jgi:flagellar basal body-associated protein FliL
MAEDKPAPAAAPAAPAADATPKKKLPIKTAAAVAVMLVVEAVAIIAAVKMFGKPSEVKGVGLEHVEHDEGDRLVEIPVLHEKFVNNSSGRVWIWDTEVIIKVKHKHAGEPEAEGKPAKGGHGEAPAEGEHGSEHAGPTVREELKERTAEVRTGIGAIMSSAQHAYFTEPARETLSRQILEYLRKVFGPDAEGHERIDEVLIPRCLGFPADY